MAWMRERLTDEHLAFLQRLPLTQTLDVDGLGEVLFCHATPRSDEEVLTRISPAERWLAAVADASERVVVCGHTHVQFDRTVDGVRIVNAGSVGMPYEREPGAYWALLGPGVEHRRSEYDVERTAREIEALGWPDEWPVATPEEATEFFERLYVAERVSVGAVGKPHGLDGAFVVDDASEDPERFAVGNKLLVGAGEVEIVESKRARRRPVIRVDRPLERGTVLEVTRASLPPPADGEYYVFQLVGLEVEEEGGVPLGRVADVAPGVANDVLELDSGLSVPMVEECIRQIDFERGRIVVAPGYSDPG
jgi:ribosomal 30S subunit maturation factor RimM